MDRSRHQARLMRVCAGMAAAGIDLLFLPPGADMQYLTGVPLPRLFWAGDGDIFRLADADGCFVSADGEVAVTFAESVWSRDGREAIEAWKAFAIEDDWPYWRLHDEERVVDLFRRVGAAVDFERGRLAIGDRAPVRQLDLLRRAFPGADVRSAGDLVLAERVRKDEEEVALLGQAQGATVRAFDEALRHARCGMTAGELADELALQLHRHGAQTLSFPPDLFAVGPSVTITYSDGEDTRRGARLDAPCAVCVDLGGVFQGYCSDLARTVYFGEPDARQHEALNVVREAQRAAADAIGPGVVAQDVDRAARRIVDAAGLGDAFWTGAGHGIGLQIHEPPALMHGTATPLASDMALAVEVGTWIDGELGAFWEDVLVVREDRAEWLSEAPGGDYVIE